MGGKKKKRMAYFLNDTYSNILKILVYLWQLITQFEAKIKLQTFLKISLKKIIIYNIYSVNKYVLIVYSVTRTILHIQEGKQNKLFKNLFQTSVIKVLSHI